ncbi:MAG: ribonuclease E/G, partial [Candidatus Accumulibacter sp.]|nr:ribonuclease E/G [Accumulibacter sp.]
QIEHQIESAYSREVSLPSGGAIVIDHTEALVSVDVNSGRSTRGADIEETAFKTNLEAAEEIARQLRLRDLGGLVVIDFIDMETSRNQREVESRLRENLRLDRARVQTSKISRFGLMELSRQRLRPALEESSYITCPRCSGTGHIRGTESAALHILRILEEEAMKENTAAIQAQIPVDVATFLFNEKRYDLQAIELRHKVGILLIPNTHLNPPQHSIARLRHDELNLDDTSLPSYKRVDAPEETETRQPVSSDHPPRQEAAVKGINVARSAPLPRAPERKTSEKEGLLGGFISMIASWFGPGNAEEETVAPPPSSHPERKLRGSERRHGGERRRNEDRETKEKRETREPSRSGHEENVKQREPKEARETRRRNGEGKRAKSKEPVVAGTALLLDDSGEKPAEENASRRRGRRGGRRERGEGKDIPAEKTQDTGTNPASIAPADATATFSPEIAGATQSPEIPPLAETPLLGAPQPTLLLPLSMSVGEVVETSGILGVSDAPTTEPLPPSKPDTVEKIAKAPKAAAPKIAASETIVELPEMSEIDIRKAIETNGLVMVETDSVKMATHVPEEEAKPRAPRRRRRQPVAATVEPLVMVETRHADPEVETPVQP